jgi:YVTN family beta-propeller protein
VEVSNQPIIAYTDGACSGNPGPGGYGVVIDEGGAVREYSGYAERTTNQRMELMAAIVALRHIPAGSRVVLHSDSAYLVRAFRDGWLLKWQRNGWRNSQREPVANQDLWEELLALAAQRDVQWEKVAGHSGVELNERCDQLARTAIKEEQGVEGVANGQRSYLLVLNKDEDTAMYIDLATRSVVKTVPLDRNPHEVVISPDGERAYVTNSGGNTLSVLDNRSMEEIDRISHPDFHFPHGLAITHDGKRLLLASTRSGKFFIFDLPELKAKQVYTTGEEFVHMVSLTPDQRTAYIANIRSNTITRFDLEREEVVEHIPVGAGPEGLAVHPAGHELYVANQHDGNLYVLSLPDHQVKHRLRVGTLPIRLVFSPDGRYAFVPNRESGDLSIVDCARPWEIKRIRLGVWPGGIVFDHAGQFAYIANNKTNDISIVDVARLKEVGRIDAGIHPDGIAYLNVGDGSQR